MNEDIASYLKNSHLFSGLSDNERRNLVKYFRKVQFTAGSVICREGDFGNQMYVLTRGEISVTKEIGLFQRELKKMYPGEVFCEMALISEGKRAATLKAATEVECFALEEKEFTQLLDENSSFAREMLEIITERMKSAEDAASHDLLNAYEALIFSLAKLAENRDPETGAHLYRVRAYTALLADLLTGKERFRESITPQFVESIYFVSPLHDIGKVAIPDAILLKPGRLDDDEFATMKTHTVQGADTIRTVMEASNQAAFQMAYNIILHHHERYDGKGYPRQLAGEDVPLEARIMALADVYDALLSIRPYKPAMSYEKTAEIIRESAGTQFDAEITEVMFDNIGEFEKIHQKFQDEG